MVNIVLNKILDTYKNNNDLIRRNINNVDILYFESLCDSSLIYEFAIKNIIKYEQIKNIENLITSPKLIISNSLYDNILYLESGYALIIHNDTTYVIEVKASLDRGIKEPTTEVSMYGAKDSFCENYQKNLGVLKRKIKTPKLKQIDFNIGVNTKTFVSLLYLDSICDKRYILSIKNKLDNLKSDINNQDILFDLFSKNKLFPTVLRSEKPSIVSDFLLDGYFVLLIDNTPFSLVIDVPLIKMINYFVHDNFVKMLRIICLILTILTPALYLALINYHMGLIPTRLLVNLIDQRLSVPFPSLIEALLMLFVCEILRESDIRFPNTYGSASSILGALIMGDAAVKAGIVSPIMIIIIAITFITSLIFTETKFVSTIRLLRIIFLLIASFLGLYGVSVLFIILIIYLKSIKLEKGRYL